MKKQFTQYAFTGSFTSPFTIIIFCILLSISSFAIGNFTGYMARPLLAADERPSEFSVFWEAWEIVEFYFVDRDKIDYKQMTYGAIRGMLDSLGDENHTVFFSPQEAEQQNSSMDGEYQGIGAYVEIDQGYFTIVAPIQGSPAESAGILAGDIVLEVDGQEVTGQAMWEVITLIRGEAGTPVVLKIVHPEEIVSQDWMEDAIEVTIIRDRIDISSVLWNKIPKSNLVYLQITQFAADTSREIDQALVEILNEENGPVEGILIDLRNNPGGFLQEVLNVISQFLPENTSILHERDAQGEVYTYYSHGPGMISDIPLVVMINEGSASASEIMAGALSQNGRAKLVGETTLGTGTVVRPFMLTDGSMIRVGVTHWLTPNFEMIRGQGISPDIVIEQSPAIEMLNGFTLNDVSRSDIYAHPDRQFNSALILLRLMTYPDPLVELE